MTVQVLVFAAGLLFAPISASIAAASAIAFAAFSLAALSLLILRYCTLAHAIRPLLILVACLAAGHLLGTLNVQRVVSAQLPEALAGDWPLRFEVSSIPVAHSRGVSFFATMLASGCDQPACARFAGMRMRLQWFGPQVTIAPGQVWSAQLRLKPPRGLANPGGFDYHAWLLSEGVQATGYVRGEANQLGQRWNLARLRDDLNQAVFGRDNYRYTRLFSALLVGDKSRITQDDWQLLKRTGTIHLMAISGLHVGFIAWLAFYLARMVARVLGFTQSGARWFHYFPPMFALFAASLYSLLAGFSIPTVRAFCSCALVCVMAIGKRRMQPSKVISAALLLVGAVQPFAVLAPGFWLSFGAVLVLLIVFSARRQQRGTGLILTQFVLFAGLLAPLVVLGQGVALVSPIANLLAVPTVTFLIVPGLFLAAALSFSPAASAGVLSGLDAAMAALWACLEWLAQLLPVWQPSQIWHPWLAVFMIFATLLLLAPRGLGLRVLGAVLLIGGLTGPLRKSYVFKLTVLDVGQGLAAVMQTPKQVWVYDTGARFSDNFDIGSGVLAPYLADEGRQAIQLVVSHGDNDHAGGVSGLHRLLRIESLLAGEIERWLKAPDLAEKARPCYAGQHWQQGKVHIEVLWPEQPTAQKGNDASCVLLVSFVLGDRNVQLLFPGDITSAVEKQILSVLPERIDVLIVPHHGSKTSSYIGFVKKLDPRYAVVSAGYKNQYRHPNEKVVARYRNQGAIVLNTASSGAITFVWYADGRVDLDQHRLTRNRLWD